MLCHGRHLIPARVGWDCLKKNILSLTVYQKVHNQLWALVKRINSKIFGLILPLPWVHHHKPCLSSRAYQWFLPSVPFCNALPRRRTSLRYPFHKPQYYPILSDQIGKVRKNRRREKSKDPLLYTCPLPSILPSPCKKGLS